MSDPAPAVGGGTLAVMQPYFFPYAGYLRLLVEADEFVIFDCVQFPRRGRVHRTQVPGPTGDVEWLTLPLASQPRDTRIRDLAFARDARRTFDGRLRRLPWIERAAGPAAPEVRAHLGAELTDVVDYLEAGLRLCADLLGIDVAISRSSALDIDPSVRGQDRVLAIATQRGASEYVNAPGGVALYDADRFAAAGIRLRFLPEYTGPHRYLLHSMLTLDPTRLLDDDR
jgi:hypothetical protein